MTLKHHIQTFLRFKHDVEYEEKETAKSGLAAVLGPISLFFALAAFPHLGAGEAIQSGELKPPAESLFTHLKARHGEDGRLFRKFWCVPPTQIVKKWEKG